MKNILAFCENAESIFFNTEKVETPLNTKQLKIDEDKVAVYRTRFSKNGDYIFNFKLSDNNNNDLNTEIERVDTLQQMFPNLFSYRYNGEHMEVVAWIKGFASNKVAVKRYKNVTAFIKLLRKKLNYVLKLKKLQVHEYDVVLPTIISTGSINIFTNAYCVDYQFEEQTSFMRRIISGDVVDTTLKVLDLSYWLKEIPPVKQKTTKKSFSKYPVTSDIIDYYPPCIKRLIEVPRKGNYGRYLLATFLLAVHHEKDAEAQFYNLLTMDEKEHVLDGNCSEQWEVIVERKYPPPSVKTMIDNGYFHDEDEIPTSLTDLEFYGYNK